MPRSQIDYIKFEVIPLEDIPFRPPVAERPIEPRGSKWDPLLAALEQNPDKAVKIIEQDSSKRGKLKSTLITMARSRGMNVRVEDPDHKTIYAYIGEGPGRYPPRAAPPMANSMEQNDNLSLTRKWAAALDGVGMALSGQAERVFKTPIRLAQADETGWVKVPGITVKIAQRIVKVIRGWKD